MTAEYKDPWQPGEFEGTTEKAERLASLGRQLLREGTFGEASVVLAEAADLYASVGQHSIQARLLEGAADAHGYAGRYAEAAEVFQKMALVSEENEDSRFLAHARWGACRAFLELDLPEAVIAEADAGLRTVRGFGFGEEFDNLEGQLLYCRAEALTRLGRWEEAKPDALAAAAAFRREKLDFRVATAHHLVAQCLHGQGRHEEALELAQRSLDCAMAWGERVNVTWLGEVHDLVGRILTAMQRYPAALFHFEQAREKFLDGYQGAGPAARTLTLTAGVHLKQGEPAKAVTALRSAIALFENVDGHPMLREAQLALSGALIELGRPQDLIRHARNTIAALDDGGPNVSAGVPAFLHHQMLGHMMLGEAERADAAYSAVEARLEWLLSCPSEDVFHVQATRAWALEQLGRHEESVALAESLLPHPAMEAIGLSQANVLRLTAGGDPLQRAKALAMYVELGEPGLALELSADLLGGT